MQFENEVKVIMTKTNLVRDLSVDPFVSTLFSSARLEEASEKNKREHASAARILPIELGLLALPQSN